MVSMHIDILTLFPDSIHAVMGESILGRAQRNDIIRIEAHQIRSYTKNKQMQVDDYPYGGGQGMLMQVQPLYDCWADVCRQAGRRSIPSTYPPPATDSPRPTPSASRTHRSVSFWSAATMRAWMSVLSRNVWTRRSAWGISCSPVASSLP